MIEEGSRLMDTGLHFTLCTAGGGSILLPRGYFGNRGKKKSKMSPSLDGSGDFLYSSPQSETNSSGHIIGKRHLPSLTIVPVFLTGVTQILCPDSSVF
jgi:hypothetical protein